MKKKDNIIVGLDIGTTKVCAVVSEVSDEGIDVIGIGTHPSYGLRKGMVINIDSTVGSIMKAVEEAELMAGTDIHSVYAGIAGGHIRGYNSNGVVAITGKEARDVDVSRVLEAAKAVNIPLDSEVIHVIPQEYIVDEQDGIKHPVGISGVRLEAKVHIVTGAATTTRNIVKCANRAGLSVQDIVLEQIASSESVLFPDEKELGVALIDIGGGTANLIIYADGSVRHTSVITVGGNHITSDIAVGLRTPIAEANKIKEKHGCAMVELVADNEKIEVPSVGGRDPRLISRKILCEIIQPRVEEIFNLIHMEIIKSGYQDSISSGIVITGGTTLMAGMPELGEKVWGIPVRRGIPDGFGGLVDIIASPMYATAVGLIKYGARQESEQPKKRSGEMGTYRRVKGRMKEWLSEFF